jgi:hypothetical protein
MRSALKVQPCNTAKCEAIQEECRLLACDAVSLVRTNVSDERIAYIFRVNIITRQTSLNLKMATGTYCETLKHEQRF